MSTRDRATLTAKELRALAHPLRLRLLELLRMGPATATMLARELDESSGATSYHLRELEKCGFVEEETGRGNARDRWWRRTTPLVMVDSNPADDAEYAAALGQLRSVIVARDEEALLRYFHTIADEPGEWQDAAFLGGWLIHATADEARELAAVIFREIDRLRRPLAERPEGARAVHITFRALLQPERET
jgi:DNA-binding transcriptional ArsR family regulator